MKVVVLLATIIVVAALSGSARAADPVLTADVGAGDGFGISLKDDTGKDVTHLATGTYTLLVHDRSDFHNFDLSGPGVSVATPIEGKGDFTFTITIADGQYFFVCDAHVAQMKGQFTAGTATPPTTTTTPAPTPTPATKVSASIGATGAVSFKPSGGLSAGKFSITVSDKSAKDGFRLSGACRRRRARRSRAPSRGR